MQEKHDICSAILYAKNVACTVFTLIIAGMYLAGAIMSKNSVFVPTPKTAMFFLLFSAVIGASSLIIRAAHVRGWQYALNFALSAASFYLCIILPTGVAKFGGASMILLVLFLAIYGVCMLVRYLLRRHKATVEETPAKYTSIFDTNDDNRKDVL